MRILFAGLLALTPTILATEALAQACPQGVVEVPRGRGATISINRTGAEATLLTVEWIRDGTGYFTKDTSDVAPEQNKAVDYKPVNAAAFAPKAGSELSVRITGSMKDGNAEKCMGEGIVRRLGEKAEVEFRAAKGGAANTIITVNYVK